MKYLIVTFALFAVVWARPQEGAQFADEAIKSAQDQQILPPGAQVLGVSIMLPVKETPKGFITLSNRFSIVNFWNRLRYVSY